MDRARQAREEIGDPTENLPPGLTRGPSRGPRRRYRWLVLAAVGVGLAVATALGAHRTAPPKITASCTKPAVKLSDTTERQGRRVAWSATGPAGRYVLTVDAPAVRVSGSAVSVDRSAAGAGREATLAGTPFTMSGCTASGHFGLALSPADHVVRLIALSGDGGRTVVSQRITVEQ
jgi:hypothetical protein